MGAYWPKMKHLNLGANQIGVEGVRRLIRIDWPELVYLYLSILSLTQRAIN